MGIADPVRHVHQPPSSGLNPPAREDAQPTGVADVDTHDALVPGSKVHSHGGLSGGYAPDRWVCVLGDPKEHLEDAYFFCSDVTMSAASIIEHYARRWNIEVTFEETRALLGLETTRHWCQQSVLRVTPILLGLFTAVVLIWHK